MLDPTSKYRAIWPSDLQGLERIHVDLFPIRYESEFFLNVVNGHGVISWGAVDTSRSYGHRDQLVGFVTTRMLAAKDSEVQEILLKISSYRQARGANDFPLQIEDLFRCNSSRRDLTLVYILTLGVLDRYRKLGIASSLIQEVIKYAKSIITCSGVYLHVISYNQPAISFYEKMLFNLVRGLPMFYYIKGQHYDSYLFVYYVNGGRSPCSLLEIATSFSVYFRGFLEVLFTKIWRNKDQRTPKWFRFKESNAFLVTQNDTGIISGEDTICHV